MKVRRSLLVLWCMIACSQAQAQILTGPIVGGQATIAGYGSQYDGIDFQQDLSLNYLGGWSYAYSVSDHSGILQRTSVQSEGKSAALQLNFYSDSRKSNILPFSRSTYSAAYY